MQNRLRGRAIKIILFAVALVILLFLFIYLRGGSTTITVANVGAEQMHLVTVRADGSAYDIGLIDVGKSKSVTVTGKDLPHVDIELLHSGTRLLSMNCELRFGQADEVVLNAAVTKVELVTTKMSCNHILGG